MTYGEKKGVGWDFWFLMKCNLWVGSGVLKRGCGVAMLGCGVEGVLCLRGPLFSDISWTFCGFRSVVAE